MDIINISQIQNNKIILQVIFFKNNNRKYLYIYRQLSVYCIVLYNIYVLILYTYIDRDIYKY